MASLRHDFGLRRSLIKLRKLDQEDFDAVLATLDDEQRVRTLSLLAALDGRSQALSTEHDEASFEPLALPGGLSPWLIARINGRGEAGDETSDQFDITRHTQSTLRRLAAELAPQTLSAGKGPSFFDQLWRWGK